MGSIRTILSRITSLFRRRALDRDLDEELSTHIDLAIEENLAKGMSTSQARTQALREFGGLTQIRETYRNRRGLPLLDQLGRDLQYGLRQLYRSPGFAATAILILAIGIGVTTAIYSVLYAVVLQPLPFPHPSELVAIGSRPLNYASIPTIEGWRARTHSFTSIAAYTNWSPRIESPAGTAHANTLLVSQNFLSTLGATFTLGHDFAQTGDETNCFEQAIVSNSYWKRMGGTNSFSASHANHTLRLDHKTYTIIGVLAPEVVLEGGGALDDPSIFTPIGCDPAKLPLAGAGSFLALGRLRPNVTLQEARVDLTTATQTLQHDFPKIYPSGLAPSLQPLVDYLAGTETRSALIVSMAACGMLLLISCSNLTNLLFARNSKRRAEFALRATLGATPKHLVGQLLTENALLGIIGALLGIALSAVLIRSLRLIDVINLPRLSQTRLSIPALLFAVALILLVTLLLTWLPATQSVRPRLLADLAGASRSASGLRSAGRLLVGLQLGMALILVASAGWMVSSVVILLNQPLGFEPDHIVIASTDLRGAFLDTKITPVKTLAILNRTLTTLRALPGVSSAAASNDKPLGGRVNRYGFFTDLHPEACDRDDPSAKPDVFLVTPGYFQNIRQQLLRGRDFQSSDGNGNHVAIVNHALASKEWPGQSPIGHRIYTDNLHAWATVVAEAADVHSYSLDRDPVPNLYLPEADAPDTNVTLMVHTQNDPALMDETIRRALRGNGDITVRYVESMPELMSHQVALRRFSMWIAAAFAGMALGLAVLGSYGLIAYEVSLREREIGIRLALGSSRKAIVSLLLQQESRWILAGTALGLFGAILTGYLLRAEFYHTRAASLPVLGTSLLVLLLPALAAVAIPSHRASLLDPAVTLRRE